MMRILAIFEQPLAKDELSSLRRQKQTVDQVQAFNAAMPLLARSSYDVILCQPFLGPEKTSAIDHLRVLRNSEYGHVPFICCETSEMHLAQNLDLKDEMHRLGGQGIISSHMFKSRNLVNHISRCLGTAVGAPCVTMRL